jgi:hypothetical protein
VCYGVNLMNWCVLWIWDYFHDKGLLFQGQGLIAHKGDNSSGQGGFSV